MTQYCISTLAGRVLGFLESDTMPVLQDDKRIAHVMVEPVAGWPKADSTTSELWIANGKLYWEETAALQELRDAALNAIDAAGEALRLAVINYMPVQTEEYRRTEAQARAWRAAGYPEDEENIAPRGVRGWAMAKHREGWTNRQACDDILGTADGWYDILDTIRDLRLLNKEDVRHADAADIAPVVAHMRVDMRAMAQQLNLNLNLPE